MKKIVFIFSVLTIMVSCGNDKAGNNDTNAVNKESDKSTDPEVEKGLDLVAKNGCFQCHKLNEQFQGPAYEAIAGRYKDDPNTIDTLAQKVIKGGSGNWGTIMMPPNSHVSFPDARSMVKYVLSLK
jgi:cytochrome c